MSTIDVAIIGAGPYGLSLAAHLAETRLTVRVFGRKMDFWAGHMPKGMVLKSEGFASTFWDPKSELTLKAFCASRGLPYQDIGYPVALQTFLDYGDAFQKRFAPRLDERMITELDRYRDGFVLSLDDGSRVTARRVVLATGIGAFQQIPCELDPIAGPLLSHSSEHRSLDRFIGQDVLIIGGGASGVEMAGLMSKNGTNVTVATRRNPIPFCDPPGPRSLIDKIHAPMSGLGTGWRSLACVMAPMLFYRMPRDFRHMVVARHLGPAPGWTSRDEVQRNVTCHLGTRLEHAAIRDGKAVITLVSADGTKRDVEADHVIAATGYKPNLHKLSWIAPNVMDRIEMADNTPVLSPYFETSVPGLFTIGVLAANNFGPLLRFVYGAGFACRRLTAHLASTAPRTAVREKPELATA